DDSDRIEYTKSGDETPGETVTVTATARDEYRFTSDLTNWDVSEAGHTATYNIKLGPTPDCNTSIGDNNPDVANPASHPSNPDTAGALPTTGSPTGWTMIAAAIGLLAAGALTLNLRKTR